MYVLILHGIMGYGGENWGEWLRDELIKLGHEVGMPTLPNADHPDRSEWLTAVSNLASGKNDLVIVAHSLSVTSALDFAEQSAKPFTGLVSVSGFADDYGLKLNSYFLKEKSINFVKARQNIGKSIVLYGDDDPYVPQPVLAKLAEDLEVEPLIIHKGGHLNASAGYEKFPQLLTAIESINLRR